MKIVSAVGILRLVCILIGLDAIIIGMFSALHCRAFGVYRRAFRDKMHMNTQGNEYEEPLDTEIEERIFKDPNDTYRTPSTGDPPYTHFYTTREVGIHPVPWEHGKAGQQAWAFILTYCIIVPLAFVISVTLFGFQIGKTEEEGCKTVVDVVFHAIAALLAIAGGALLICAAVIPDSAHKKDLEYDATHNWKYSRVEWERIAIEAEISKKELDDFFTISDENTYKLENAAAQIDRDKLIKHWEKWGKKALDKFKDKVQKVYRYDINFEWKLAGGAITIVYGIVLIVTTVMIGLSLCKRKKVEPIPPPPPPPPPPVVEEVAPEETPSEAATAEAASTDASTAES